MANACVTNGVCCAAVGNTAYQPPRCVVRLFGRVADTTNEKLLHWRGTDGQRNERVAFGALRGIVYNLWANTAVFIQPLSGNIDSRDESLENTFAADVEVACVASGASAVVFNARTAQTTLAISLVRVLIPKSSTGVTCGALQSDISV
jgi:hypothetical protein